MAVYNEEHIFWLGNISDQIWNYKIGGKQQIKEWLNARKYTEINNPRKNRITHPLSHKEEELIYLRKMVSVIKKTLEIQFSNQENTDSKITELYNKILSNLHHFNINDLNKIVKSVSSKKNLFKKIDTWT